ncbi:MAG: hypothetical protein ACRELX_08740, partial [Longimicrobiales bacterium]
MITRAALADRLRRTVFRAPQRSGGPPRIGAEAELLALDAATFRVVPVAERLLPFLHEHASRLGWAACPSVKGAPRFALPNGGAITLEPGGQVEYATPPHDVPVA